MKRCSTSLVTRKMPDKPKMRYHFISTSMTIIKRWTVTSLGEDMEKLESYWIAGENVK